MEIIKKKIKLITTSGATSGCTDCYIIVPDLTVNYNFKILLKSQNIDLGYFDSYIE